MLLRTSIGLRWAVVGTLFSVSMSFTLSMFGCRVSQLFAVIAGLLLVVALAVGAIFFAQDALKSIRPRHKGRVGKERTLVYTALALAGVTLFSVFAAVGLYLLWTWLLTVGFWTPFCE